MAYFVSVTSFDDLKKQYRALALKYHPDTGGSTEAMQEINAEYDVLFPVWIIRDNVQTAETATTSRSEFYTQNGWKGNRHDWHRSLKDIAQIVRAYVKQKYPNYKFSVRTSYASMCQELHIELKESPVEVYKTFGELTDDDKNTLRRRMMRNDLFKLDCWTDAELKTEFERVWNENGNFYRCLNDVTQAVIDDVDKFVKSYNYEDCDGQIDYCNVDFYYFGCVQNNGQDIKIVKPANKSDYLSCNDYTYKITKGIDTRDGSELWVVKFSNKMTREEYLSVSAQINSIGGYYSKYKHGFIFKNDPTEPLNSLFK
jgi:hypothetical protein